MTVDHLEQSAYTWVGDPNEAKGPFVFICEHASNHVPGRTLTPSDRALLDAHWGWDIGAADVVKGLCKRFNSVGVLSTYSRLLIDVNRHPTSETLIVTECQGVPVSFNQEVSGEDRAWRERIYREYHAGVDEALKLRLQRGPIHLVSIHSFTPIWRGQARAMEIGLVFDRYEIQAQSVAQTLNARGRKTALNEPYSGQTGELMFSPAHHGQGHEIPYLEFELRQDLLRTSAGIEGMIDDLVAGLTSFLPPDHVS